MECGGGRLPRSELPHLQDLQHAPLGEGDLRGAERLFFWFARIPVSAVITSVKGRKVTSLRDFEQALAASAQQGDVRGERNYSYE